MSIGAELRNLVDVRLADPSKEPVTEWCIINAKRNAFDAGVLDYPATRVLAAHESGKVSVYLPIQPVTMLESIGTNPSCTPLEITAGVVAAVKGACLMAYTANHREIYFLASDAITAEGSKLLGFEEVPFKVYRKKL